MVSSVNQMEAVQKRAVSERPRPVEGRQRPSPSRFTLGDCAKPRWFSYFEDAWSRAKGHSSFALFGSAAMRLTKIDPNPRFLAPNKSASFLNSRFLAPSSRASSISLSPRFFALTWDFVTPCDLQPSGKSQYLPTLKFQYDVDAACKSVVRFAQTPRGYSIR